MVSMQKNFMTTKKCMCIYWLQHAFTHIAFIGTLIQMSCSLFHHMMRILASAKWVALLITIAHIACMFKPLYVVYMHQVPSVQQSWLSDSYGVHCTCVCMCESVCVCGCAHVRTSVHMACACVCAHLPDGWIACTNGSPTVSCDEIPSDLVTIQQATTAGIP